MPRALTSLQIAFILALASLLPRASAQLSIDAVGPQYIQTFNAIGSTAAATLPSGWKVDSVSGSPTTSYASAVTATTQNGGTSGGGVLTSGSNGGTYNFATGANGSSTERSVGWLSTATYIAPRQLFLQMTNNTGTTITTLEITYKIKKFRNGTNSNTPNITFYTSTNGTAWTQQTALTQNYTNDANNNVVNPPTVTTKTLTLKSLAILNGTSLYLRWQYAVPANTNAPGLGIDDFGVRVPANVAYDYASNPTYNAGWSNNQTGGFGFAGFGKWTAPNGGGASGILLNSSTANGNAGAGVDTNLDLDIDSVSTGTTRSFGLYAANSQVQAVGRSLTAAMEVGDSFGIKLDNGSVQSSGGSVGFGLVNGNDNALFGFTLVGGEAGYRVTDGVNNNLFTPNLATTLEGLRLIFTLTSNNNYALSILTINGATLRSTTGTLVNAVGGNKIKGFALLDTSAATGPGANAQQQASFFFNDVWENDPIAPTVSSIQRDDATPTSASLVNYTVTFSEPVTGVTASNFGFSVTGTLSGISITTITGTGDKRTVTLNTGTGDGNLRLLLVNNTNIVDVGNNKLATATFQGQQYKIDKSAPTVSSINRANPSPTNAGSVNYTVNFSDNILNLTTAAFSLTSSNTLTGATITGITGSGSSFTVSVNTGTGNGGLRLDITNFTGLTDDAGNPFLITSYKAGAIYKIDNVGPIPTLTSTVTSFTNTFFNVTATFNESTSSTFALGDITVTNGGASLLAGGPTVYTFRVTPTAGGPVTVQVQSGTVTDTLGNPNSDSNTISTTYDATAPVVDQKTPDAGEVVAALPTVSVHFTEIVTSVTAGMLTVNGLPATSVSGTDDGPYVFSGYPVPADGTVNISLNGALIKDAATNAVGTLNWAYTKNSAAVTVTITGSTVNDGEATRTSPELFIATFSAAVTGFASGDISVTGGSVTSFTPVSGTVYNFQVTPGGQGNVTVQIAAGVANLSVPPATANSASNAYNYVFDNVAPTVTLTPDTTIATNAPFNVTVAVNEPTTNLASGDITLTNASISNFAGTNGNYTFTVNPTTAGTTVTVKVNADVLTDEAGNNNTASNTISILYDTTPPTIAIAPDVAVNFNTSPFHVAVTLSEPSTNFAVGDLSVSSGTVSNFTGSGANYSFTVTPTAQGTVLVQIFDSICTDLAGNPNSASNVLVLNYDSIAPIPTLSTLMSDPTTSNPLLGTLTFSENITGLTSATLVIAGGTLASFTQVDAVTCNFSVIPAAPDSNITIDLPAGATQDAAGNLSSAAAQLTRHYDVDPPQIAIGAPSVSVTTSGPVDFPLTVTGATTVTMSPAYVSLSTSGTAIGTVVVLNGNTANPIIRFSGITGDGTFHFSLLGGIATDLPGNLSGPAGPSADVFVDNAIPQIAGLIGIIGSNKLRVSFTEPVQGATTLINFQVTGTGLGNVPDNASPFSITAINSQTYDLFFSGLFGTSSITLTTTNVSDLTNNPITPNTATATLVAPDNAVTPTWRDYPAE